MTAFLALCTGCEPGSPASGSPEAMPLQEGSKESGQQTGLRLTRETAIDLLLPDSPSSQEQEAAAMLADYLEGAFGRRPRILPETASDQASTDRLPISIGETEIARMEGLSAESFTGETYAIAVTPHAVILNGRVLTGGFNRARDRYQGRPLLWAVNGFADRFLGVRWLWPGNLGTHIPQHKEVTLPLGTLRLEPDLLLRRLRIPRQVANGNVGSLEAMTRWLEAFQVGQREEIPFAHAFVGWWERFGQSRPDLFALPPGNYRQPWPKPGLVKLRLANPAVAAQIADDYQKAGAPPYWNIAPNDSIGFDTSEETRAWDLPPASRPEAIWLGETNLTPRYVRFWNEVHAKLSAINPDVTLCTILYGRYRTPPPPGRELVAPMVLATVDTPVSYDEWKAWRGKANRMILRPNWWHSGANAPELPLTREGKFLEFARANGLIGYDFDSLIGYWGTQGARYYVTARLLARPDYTTERAIDDYLSAFGSAAPAIRQYLALWEEKSEQAAYTIDVGGPGSINTRGEFERIAQRLGHSGHPISGSYRVMSELYDDTLLARGTRLLADATAAARAAGEATVEKRISFLAHGLEEFRQTRDLLALGYRLRSEPTAALQKAFLAKAAGLKTFRQSLEEEGVIWPTVLYQRELHYKIPSTPEVLKAIEPDLRGM